MMERNGKWNTVDSMASKLSERHLLSLLEGLHRTRRKGADSIADPDIAYYFPDEESQRSLAEVESLVNASYWEWDAEKKRAYLSPGACRMVGKPEDWSPGTLELARLLRKIDRGKFLKLLIKAIRERKTFISYECEAEWNGRFLDLSVRSRIRHDGPNPGIIAIAQNVTMMKDYERALREAVFIDSLTGLANRSLFRTRLKQVISRAETEKKSVAVLMLDLNDFKRINDTLGHAAGDKLLQEAGCRLTDIIRPEDLVARMGGDEFAVLLPDLTDDGAPRILSEKILSAFVRPLIVAHQEIFMSVCIGISLYPSDAREIAALLSFADMAMVHAKEEGKSTFRFYSTELRDRSARRLTLENLLRGAVARNELELYYQPQVDIHTGEVKGAEALIRWNNPEMGRIGPDEFIEIAEKSGLILEIGRWILRESFLTAVRWNEKRRRSMKIAVNLSPRQFQAEYDLVGVISGMLQETGCRAEWIEFEITEGLFFRDFEQANKILHALHHKGFSIALDDFGTGYSAMNRLRRLPVKVIKIDRTFFQGIPACQTASDLVLAMISMAKILHLDIIAEGVEKNDQVEFLAGTDCFTAQGYHFSRPVPRDIFEREILSPDSKNPEPSGDISGPKPETPIRSFCWYRAAEICFVPGDSHTCSFHEDSR